MMTSTLKASISADLVDFIDKVSTNVRIVDAFLVGSIAELPLEYLLSTPDDLTIDQLKFQWNECAVPHGSTPPDGFSGTVFHVEPVARRPGYAWLLQSGGELEDPRNYFGYVSTPNEVSAVRRWTKNTPRRSATLIDRYDMNEFLLSQHPLASQLMAYKKFSMHVHPSVICFRWPSEASEWAARSRTRGWPSAALVKSVTATGCHLTPCVVERSESRRAMFRYSFSVAEVMLIRTWNHVQRYVFNILRLIKKDAAKQMRARGHDSVVDTYHFKTLMLWACETRPAEFWQKGNVRSSIGELLCQMVECLVEKNCPNYFIPTNNLFEHLTDNLDLEAEIAPLLVYKEQGASRLAASVPMIDQTTTTTALLFSDKILNMGYIGLGSVNLRPWSRISTSAVRRSKLTNLPDHSEFEQLYSAIKTHRGLVLSRNKIEIGAAMQGSSSESQKSDDMIEKTIRHFEQAMSSETSSKHSVPVCLGNTLSEVISSIFKISDYPETHEGDSDENNSAPENSDDLDHTKPSVSDKDKPPSFTANEPKQNNSVQRNASQSCRSDREDAAGSHSGFQTVLGLCLNAILPTIDKQLPKVTYFISAAYRANFYHTYMKDYQMSLRVCEEALKQTKGREFTLLSIFNDQVCSVVLSRKSLSIFDEHIQLIYGFLTLSQTLRNSSGTAPASATEQSICVAEPLLYLSPRDFLQYVKLRCERRLLRCSSYGDVESMRQSTYHLTFRSPEILQAALRISDARSRTHRKLQLPSWYDAENRPHYWN